MQNISNLHYRIKAGTMLLPIHGIQTLYFVTEDFGLTIDVLSAQTDGKYEFYDKVDKKYFKLHPNFDAHIEQDLCEIHK